MQTQEINRDSKPIHIGGIITIGNCQKVSQLKPKESMMNITKTKPLFRTVKTIKHPTQIVDEFMDWNDKDQMIKHLITYQKSGDDRNWDNYRNRIPDELLEKWGNVILQCRMNGYLSPRAYDNKIVWKTMTTYHPEMCDQCSACPNVFISGECKGQIRPKLEGVEWKRNFVPCWK